MTVGERVRALRLEQKMNQTELASAANVDTTDISALENDRRPFGPDRLARLAAALDTTVEDLMADDDGGTTHSTDDEPTPFRRPAKAKPGPKAGPKFTSAKGIPLAVQLQLPYNLLSNVTAARLPVTSQVLAQQARPCAEAWDTFLLRYPALREKIEQGMIAGDVIALIMAHLPILAAAREEIAARAQMAEQYGDRPYQPAT